MYKPEESKFLFEVMGFNFVPIYIIDNKSEEEISQLIEQRNIYKQNKDYSQADKIRDILLKYVVFEDGSGYYFT